MTHPHLFANSPILRFATSKPSSMDSKEKTAIVQAKIVGTQLMDALKAESPSTRFEFRNDHKEIAAWDEGRKKWMAICTISNMGDWTRASHILPYVDGDHTANQSMYPKAA